ncbi:lytic transglycosylase domain-containing protein [Nocardioides hankookensis]|uniref:Lytic transglycosylase domain-containing protein n=1 Tax=Nocardioides hankookensis TaxID=443157 RepID=A0ABW1LRR3_9ACTN
MFRPTRLAATTAAVLIPLAVATGSGAPPIPVSADLGAEAAPASAAEAAPAPTTDTTWAAPTRGIPVAEARPALAARGAVDALDIPLGALAAYQRATTIIADVQPDCGLRWEQLAAIGRIESDHGRVGGATLNVDGTSSPAVRGPVLDGQGDLAAVSDTDAGLYDGDARWDRAIGPMQFLPSTWTEVGVDADGDGVRSADDLDDAALGAAVYLCAGGEHLDTPTGAWAAIFRYNHSSAYVTRVLQVAHTYEQGRAATVPATVPVTSVAPPVTNVEATAHPHADHHRPTKGDFVEVRPAGGRPPTVPEPDPTPTDPEPTPTEPTPTEPTPTEPTPDPEPATLNGVLAVCADDPAHWCLGDTVLDLGDDAWLATTATDGLDADGVVESNRDEITGLVGTEVTLGVVADTAPARVVSVNGIAYGVQ